MVYVSLRLVIVVLLTQTQNSLYRVISLADECENGPTSLAVFVHFYDCHSAEIT